MFGRNVAVALAWAAGPANGGDSPLCAQNQARSERLADATTPHPPRFGTWCKARGCAASRKLVAAGLEGTAEQAAGAQFLQPRLPRG